MQIVLKPCPFCGHEASIESPIGRLYSPAVRYSVVCNGCDLYFGYDIDYGGEFATEEKAAEAWNRRAKDADVTDMNVGKKEE